VIHANSQLVCFQRSCYGRAPGDHRQLSSRTKDQNIGYIDEYLTALGIDLKEVRAGVPSIMVRSLRRPNVRSRRC
jgi:hypothetical protein